MFEFAPRTVPSVACYRSGDYAFGGKYILELLRMILEVLRDILESLIYIYREREIYIQEFLRDIL